MSYLETIDKIASELPLQIRMIEERYGDIHDPVEHKAKMDDLRAYDKRMRDGLDFLRQISDENIIRAIENIRKPSEELLRDNKIRYIASLEKHRTRHGIRTRQDRDSIVHELRRIPLIHTTKYSEEVRKRGLSPASELWLTPYKSCANAMDIVAGLDRCVFLTHGFSLSAHGGDRVAFPSELIDRPDCIVSTLDLFAFVLIRTGRVAPCAIQTSEWVDSLAEYSRNLFRGCDFWEIKSEYILTFFSSIAEYTEFARNQFYANRVEQAPQGEHPFVGEVKIFSSIGSENIVSG